MSTGPRSLVLSLFILGAMALPAHAFDGDRKGFFLGVGGGVGGASYKQTLEGLLFVASDSAYAAYDSLLSVRGSSRENKAGFASDFRIGFGVSQQVLVFYDHKRNWFNLGDAYPEMVDIAYGLSSAGVSYYLKPESPSAYLTGGVGIAGSSGFGLFGGAGYELTRLWSLEGTISYSMASSEERGFKSTADSFSLRFQLIILAY